MHIWNRARTTTVGGIVAAMILAGGGVAVASAQGRTSGAGPATSTSRTATARRPGLRSLRFVSRLEYGRFVMRGRHGTVTRDIIRGTVLAVSSSRLSVRAADGTTQSYAVTARTKVRVRSGGRGTVGSIGSVATGDRVIVLGTGAGALSADRVIDLKGRPARTAA